MTSAAALSLVLSSVATAVTVPALAHISLDAPKGRYWQTSAMQTDQVKQKTSPCGSGADSRTKDASLIATYQPGAKVTVKFRETIQHPGHFEISFDNDGQDFPFPGEAPSATSGVTVLTSNIADKSSADYSVEVTLPNVECEKCTLQLVQVMTTKMPPYSKNGDLYFQCADLVLKAGGGGGTGGTSAGGASASGGAMTSGGMGGVASGTGGVTFGGMNAGGATTGGTFAVTGGSSSSTGGMFAGTATGGTNSSTGGTLTGTGTGGSASTTGGTSVGNATGGSASTTGGVPNTNPPPAGNSGVPGPVEEPGCSVTRSPRSGAALSLFALTALLGWQRRRRGTARRRR